MRENQRGNRTYADNASAGTQQGRNKQENAVEINVKQSQEESAGKPVSNCSSSEGMIYIDIIPRFAL